jgi:hypothetical protein
MKPFLKSGKGESTYDNRNANKNNQNQQSKEEKHITAQRILQYAENL